MTRTGPSMVPSKSPLRLGLLGLGTVGQAVLALIEQHGAIYAARTGRSLEVTAVSARNRHRARRVDISVYRWYDDASALAMAEDVDVVIEVAGGVDAAYAVAEAALSAGKHWVTANKALLAEHGQALIALAHENHAMIGFEAAVCGAIPVVKTLREGLAANLVDDVQGIFNGTCNYIFTQMANGMGFEAALADATAKGYAEADPALDIGGVDAAHKTALMAALVSDGTVDFTAVSVEGITGVPDGISAQLAQHGYVLKLLGQCRLLAHGWAVWVYPAAVPQSHPLARIDGVVNAVAYHGNAADFGMLQGLGAGGAATASAVLSDVLDIAAGRGVIAGGLPNGSETTVVPVSERVGAYWVAVSDGGASLTAVLQNISAGLTNLGTALLVSEVREADLRDALNAQQYAGAWIRVEGV